MEQWQTYCPNCQKNVLGQRESTNHILHFLITFLTCGLWLLVWILIAHGNGSKPWLCPTCGTPGVNS
jgi:hypothetical protein